MNTNNNRIAELLSLLEYYEKEKELYRPSNGRCVCPEFSKISEKEYKIREKIEEIRKELLK